MYHCKTSPDEHAGAPSRFDSAVATLAAGGALVLCDEARPAEAAIVALEGRASPEAHALLKAQGARRIGEAHRAGVLGRPGIGEAATDLAAAAGGATALVARLTLPGGVLAREDAAAATARDLGLALVSIQDVIDHRLRHEAVVEAVAEAALPSLYAEGPLRIHAFRSLVDGCEHVALVHRPPGGFGPAPVVRLHSECLTGDALGSLRCDCGDQLRGAMRRVGEEPEGGAVLYLRGQEGRGIGLANKIRAYALQERGRDTVDANVELGFPADARDYGAAIGMLRALGIGRVRLLSNNPTKSAALTRYGIEVAERLSIRVGPNPHNAAYLATKRARMGHDLPADDAEPGRRAVSD